MSNAKQLEIAFESQMEVARSDPATANVSSLWNRLEIGLRCLSDQSQLHLGAQAIAQLAELLDAKSANLLKEWECRYAASPTSDPVLHADALAGVLRQSMTLDLVNTIQRYTPHRSRLEQPIPDPIQSVVAEIDKADMLHWLETDNSLVDVAIAPAHEESVSAWIGAIAHYLSASMAASPESVRLIDLQTALDLPLIEIWLGLLLGDLGLLEQREDDFYAPDGLYLTPVSIHWHHQ